MSLHPSHRSCRTRAFCTAVGLLALGSDSRKGLRISGPMTALGFGGDVIGAKFSPDGARAVFSSDADQDNLFELYSVPTDGSAPPVKLNSPVVSGGDVETFLLSPDSERVVFWGDLSTDGKRELYSAPIDASAPAVKLNAPIGAGGSVTMTFEPCVQISPDSTCVVYLAVSGAGVHELFSVPIDGSAPAAKINGPLVPGGDVGFFIFFGGSPQLFRPGFLISPDSSRVVYLANQDVNSPSELFAVPIDGGPTIQLNHPLPPGTFLGAQTPHEGAGFQIGPDGQWVTYLAKSSEQELWSVPIDAHLPAVRLNADLFGPSSRVESDYRISADSSTVYFRADHDQGLLLELCRVPIDGSAAPVQLTDLATYPSIEYGFEIGATHAAYRRGDELFGVPLDGSAPPTPISGPKPLGSFDVPLRITADGSRLVYRSVQGSAKRELYSVPVDGSALPVRLNSHLVFGGNVVDFALDPTGDRVVYRADGQLVQVFELYSVPVDASAPAVKINAPLVPAGDVQSVFEIGPDGARVIYLADQEVPDVVELFAVPIEGSLPAVQLNGGLSAPTLAGDVTAFALAPVGNHVVYRADQDTDEVFELYGVPLPRSPSDPIAPENRLSGPYQNVASGFRVSPDGSRVVYLASRDDIAFTLRGLELFGAPVDGSSPAVRISQPLAAVGTVGTFAGTFEISPDSSRVVYLADPYRTDTVELFMTAIDGSSPPVHLNQPFHRFGTTVSGHQVDEPIEREVQHFRISPDGSRVVYEADQDQAFVFELYTVPIDRSQRPRKLHPPLDTGRVSLVGISPDSERVLFLLGGQLHSAAIDARGPSIVLTEPPLVPGSCGTVTIAPDSSRVAFVARTEGSNFSELFSAPLDGSQSPTKLSAAFPQGSEGFCAINTPFKLAPQGGRVVYIAEQQTRFALELFSVPVDGSAPPTKLNATLPSGGNVSTFEITPDGTRVVYGADQDVDGLFEVFAVPIDGSAAPVQINGPLVAGGVAAFASIAPDGLRVLYWGDQDTNEVFELFSASIRGRQSVKVNAPLVAGGDVRLPGNTILPFYGITPDGTRAIYVADQETDERFELHLSFLDPYARRL